ncbi:hypothetical protein K9L67_01775 [Candidatus Woesearchaeota archaeon]|nr:hypothetical protein [Candidatus Woesearchaeota archaeon]MCF8012869.1 hypothetical protein [Candidatus Woesearchaeota archaeon]
MIKDSGIDGFIIYPTYRVEDNKSYVYLFGRLSDGRSFCTKNYFEYYFFIKGIDLSKANKLGKFKSNPTNLKSFKEDQLIKIILNSPKEISDVRKVFEENLIDCFEADVRFAYKFLMDMNLKGTLKIEGKESKNDDLRVDVFFDEPFLSNSDWKPKQDNLKILSADIECSMDLKNLYCISMVSNDNKLNEVLIISKDSKLKNAVLFDDEKSLLEAFKEKLIKFDPDIITGWNLIDFDFKFIKSKFDKYKIKFDLGRTTENSSLKIYDSFLTDSKADFAGRIVLDGIHMLKSSFIKLDDYKLGTAAKKFTDEKKLIEDDNKGEDIESAFKDNQQKLIDYNLLDSKLVLDIIDKSGVMNLTILRSLLTGMPLDRVRASIASLDSLYLRKLRKRGYAALSTAFNRRDQRSVGGYVMKSKPGIYNYVIVLDFKSLYPSLMITFNIDPLMHRPNCQVIIEDEELIKSPSGTCFSKHLGILPEILKELWEIRTKAQKNKDELTRYAVKILMNSFYGVLASPNCRFFSLEIANAITDGFAHTTIKRTKDEIEKKGFEVIYGDSITKNRFVTIKDSKGIIRIVNIKNLFNKNIDSINKSRGKEFVFPKNIKALCFDKNTLKPKFSNLKTIIRHKTNKKVFRINQKFGETICSEDHSLISLSNNKLEKIKPLDLFKTNKPMEIIKEIPSVKELKIIDLYDLLKEYSFTSQYKGRFKKSECKLYSNEYIQFNWTNRNKPVLLKRFIKVNSKDMESLCRLIGLYIAEGSSSTPETTKSRIGASISISDKNLLVQIQKDYYKFFKNVKASIIESDSKKNRVIKKGKKTYSYNDKTLKLQMMNNISAVFFKVLAGQKSNGKKIPDFMYNLPNKYKKILLKYMILGDGSLYDSRYSKEFIKKHFRYETNSLQLISGLSLLLKQLGFNFSINYRPSKKSYRISTANKNNVRLNTKIEQINYDDYLYDLSVDDDNFVDSCGQVALHNTDSVFVNLKCDSDEEAEKLGKSLENELNTFFKKHVKDEYGVESFLELEFEKTFRKFLMPTVRGSEEGAKKRYAGLLVDTSSDAKNGERMDFTGLEFVRRDWTPVSKKFQLELLDLIFHDKKIDDYIRDFVNNLKSGKYDDLLIYRKALRKDADEYTKTTPPHVKAARKLDKITSNIIDYVLTVDGPEPIQKIEHSIDYDHYIDKQIKPIAESVLGFFDQDFDNVLKNSEQKNLFDY